MGKAGPLGVNNSHFTAILQGTAHPDEAWEFLKFFVEEGDSLFAANFQYPVTIPGARTLAEQQPQILPSGYDVWSFYEPVLDPPANGIICPATIPGWNRIAALLSEALGSVRNGEKPASVALQEIAGQANAILTETR